MAYILRAQSGAVAIVRSDELARSERIAGLDEDGRIVVDDFNAREAPYVKREPGFTGYLHEPFMFGLTLCCQASDKGCEDGIFCRACYGSAPNADAGNYLYKEADGSFPGLDPIAELYKADGTGEVKVDA